jgi:hypothetical protein
MCRVNGRRKYKPAANVPGLYLRRPLTRPPLRGAGRIASVSRKRNLGVLGVLGVLGALGGLGGSPRDECSVTGHRSWRWNRGGANR